MHTCTHKYIPTYIPSVHIYTVIFTCIAMVFKYIQICVYLCVCV